MPTNLNTNKNANDLTKKLWEKHQADEFTHVDHYKEAVCINCFKKDASSATIADILYSIKSGGVKSNSNSFSMFPNFPSMPLNNSSTSPKITLRTIFSLPLKFTI